MKQILTVLTYIATGLYLLVDVIFMTLAKPIANWIDKHVPLRRLRDWIRSLPPYSFSRFVFRTSHRARAD